LGTALALFNACKYFATSSEVVVASLNFIASSPFVNSVLYKFLVSVFKFIAGFFLNSLFIAITLSKEDLSLLDAEASRAPKLVLFFLKKSVVKVFNTDCALVGTLSFTFK